MDHLTNYQLFRVVPGEVIVREWVPLTYLTDKIPTRLHEGFGVRDTVLTCVALAADSIAAGCTSGIIFWFSRRSARYQIT